MSRASNCALPNEGPRSKIGRVGNLPSIGTGTTPFFSSGVLKWYISSSTTIIGPTQSMLLLTAEVPWISGDNFTFTFLQNARIHLSFRNAEYYFSISRCRELCVAWPPFYSSPIFFPGCLVSTAIAGSNFFKLLSKLISVFFGLALRAIPVISNNIGRLFSFWAMTSRRISLKIIFLRFSSCGQTILFCTGDYCYVRKTDDLPDVLRTVNLLPSDQKKDFA